jgi:hypothetical protein
VGCCVTTVMRVNLCKDVRSAVKKRGRSLKLWLLCMMVHCAGPTGPTGCSLEMCSVQASTLRVEYWMDLLSGNLQVAFTDGPFEDQSVVSTECHSQHSKF